MSRKCPPWGDILGEPIERMSWKDEDELRVEQARKMMRIKAHYGLGHKAGWYEMALALAMELDPALSIEDPKPIGSRDKIWHAKGKQLFEQVQYLWEQGRKADKNGYEPTLDSVLTDLRLRSPFWWGKLSPATLKRRYLEEKARRELGANNASK